MFRWLIEITAKILLFIMAVENLQPVVAGIDFVSTAEAVNWQCGRDINGDGEVGQGEMAACFVSEQGQLCPIDAVDCVATYSDVTCPPGTTLNPATDKCEAVPVISCPSGYTYDKALDKCVQAATCSSNGVLNPNTDKCEILFGTNLCPSGYIYSSGYQSCIKDVTCLLTGVYNPVSDKCETPVLYNCPSGTTYNSITRKCEGSPTCPSGFVYSASANACVQSATMSCPPGYTYNSSTRKCESAPTCPAGGSYSNANNRCEAGVVYLYRCPISGQTYSDQTTCNSNCVSATSCTGSSISVKGNITYDIPPSVFCSLSHKFVLVGNGNKIDFYYTMTSAQDYIGSITFPAGVSIQGGIILIPGVSASFGGYKNILYATDGAGGGFLLFNENIEVSGSFSLYVPCSRGIRMFIQGVGSSLSIRESQRNTGGYINFSTFTCPVSGGSSCSSNLQVCRNSSQTAGCSKLPVSVSGGATVESVSSYYPYRSIELRGNSNVIQIIGNDGYYSGSYQLGSITFPAGVSISGSIKLERGKGFYPIVGFIGSGNSLYALGDSQSGVLTFSGGIDVSGWFFIDFGDWLFTPSYLYIQATNNSLRIYNSKNNTGGYVYFNTFACPLPGGTSCYSGQEACSKPASCGPYTTCPPNYWLSGSICVANPSCSYGGSLNTVTDKCEITPTPSCPSGSTYNAALGMCVTAAICPSGSVLNVSSDKCEATVGYGCVSGYTYDPQTGICKSDPICNPGVFDSTIDKCRVSASLLCPTGYTFNSSTNKCEYSPPTCPSGSSYSTVVDKCVTDATHTCPVSTSYSPVTRLCESVPVCNTGTYSGTADKCFEGNTTCPVGNYKCLPNATNVMQCSPNACVDIDSTPPVTGIIVDPGPIDDGVRGPDGSCLGTVYIFNGRAMRCRKSGYSTGFHNCCDNTQGVLSDDIKGVNPLGPIKYIGMLKKGYEIIKGAALAAKVGGDTFGVYSISKNANGSITVMKYLGSGKTTKVATLTGDSAKAFGSVVPGMGADAAANSFLSSYAQIVGPQLALSLITMAINDPVLSAAVNLVGQALLGAGPIGIGLAVINLAMALFLERCDPEDLETAMLNESKFCHEVGTYCEKKWLGIGCVQKARGFCCFNSKLARIVHEQGRPQLQAFSGGWGEPKSPNCRGFTPEEFQMIDFSKLDLSEYYGDIQKDIDSKVQSIQNNATQKIQDFYRGTR